ncbi:MAG: Crp/Fnr family transcriptional regulator [Bacteroidota bacterium]
MEDRTNPEKLIIDHFAGFIEVSDDLKSQLLRRIKVVQYKKGQVLVKAGKICTKSYFLVKGITKTYFMKEDKEVIEYFGSKNQWANSPRSWRTNKPDVYYVEALENVTALCIKVNDMKFLFDHFPELDRYGRLSMITLLDHLLERITSFRFTNAEEKYTHFKKTYPKIHHRIPLGMVASYLGISQETLSRTRAKR